MLELSVWVAALALSVVGLVWLAFLNQFALHTILAATTAFAIAAITVSRAIRARAAGQGEADLARLHAVHMGMVWAWGTVAVTATYLIVLDWKEWWQYALAFAAATSLAFVIARRLQDGASDGLRRITRWLAGVQLAGMLIAVVGLIADDKMGFEWVDWAGNTIFFFGAMALAVISAEALRS